MTYQHDSYAGEFKHRATIDWTTAVRFAMGEGPAPARPHQVEVHLASVWKPMCLMRCVDCHGRFLHDVPAMTAEDYDRLLDDLKEMGIPAMVLSGAYSDPTVDEELIIRVLRQAGPTWGVRLHTYGLSLTDAVQEAIVEAAMADPAQQSYVTLSKVTVWPYVYAQMCRPKTDDVGEWLRQDNERLQKFFRRTEGLPLTVRLNCRVTRLNGEVGDLADLMRWLADASPSVELRFTSDYLPSRSPEHYQQMFYDTIYLSPAEARDRVDRALALVSDDDMAFAGRVSFRDAEQSRYPGTRCWNSLLFSAVSTSGLVMPCQSIASGVYGRLAYGRLTEERFPACWQRYMNDYWSRSWRDDDGCPKCTAACERQINEAIQREVEDGSL